MLPVGSADGESKSVRLLKPNPLLPMDNDKTNATRKPKKQRISNLKFHNLLLLVVKGPAAALRV